MTERSQERRTGAVADYMTERTGLDFSGTRGQWLRDVAFGDRVEGGVASRLLKGDTEAFASLCATATVQESYFFREPVTLAFLRETVLPELAARPGEIRVWSAGCAAGEEAYTLAMMLADAGIGQRAQVLGTDLSFAAIAKARQGVYGSWSLRGVNQAAAARYLRRTDTGYAVLDRYRLGVEFAEHNLLSDVPARAPFDLVLCRNVLIYFTPEAVRQVTARLVAALRPGGWLLTGVSDPVLDGVEGLTRLETNMGTAYRRSSPADIAAPPRLAPEARPQPRRVRAAARTVAAITTKPAPSRPAADRQWQAFAEQALSQAHPREAERLARQALEQPVDRAEAYSVLVRALAADGRLDDAAEVGKRAVAELPVAAELRAVTAAALLEAGRTQDARVAAREALYLNPELALALVVLARAAELMGDATVAARMRRNADRLVKKAVAP